MLNDHLQLQGTTSVWDAMQAMEGFQGESVPVVGKDAVYLGALYESTLIRVYLQTLEDIRAETNAIG